MNQKTNKIIVLLFIIISCISTFIFISYYKNYPIIKCNKIRNNLRNIDNQKEPRREIPPPQVINCIEINNTVSLILPKEVKDIFKRMAMGENIVLVKNINLESVFNNYINIEKLRSEKKIIIPEGFQICLIIPHSKENDYTLSPKIFRASFYQNEIYDFYCSSLLQISDLSNLNINIKINKVKQNIYNNFFVLLYLIPNKFESDIIKAQKFAHEINQYPLIGQF